MQSQRSLKIAGFLRASRFAVVNRFQACVAEIRFETRSQPAIAVMPLALGSCVACVVADIALDNPLSRRRRPPVSLRGSSPQSEKPVPRLPRSDRRLLETGCGLFVGNWRLQPKLLRADPPLRAFL